MKKFFYLFFFSFLFLSCTKTNMDSKDSISIVTTSFPIYDFTRAIISNVNNDYIAENNFTNVDIKLLIKPGMETHSFDPSPKDIIDIQNADIFIRMGGESEVWVDKIISTSNKLPKKILTLKDFVETCTSLSEDKHHNHHEHDEHYWTSSKNAIKMINAILQSIIELDNEKSNGKNITTYQENANSYIKMIENLSNEIKNTVDNSENKLLIFGDRFPFTYFTEEYGLNYLAAFDGCSTAVEAKTSKIAELIDEAKNSKAKAIFTIEMSNKKIANTIAQASNAKVLELHSCQNVSKDDFEQGITYAYTMKSNLDALKIGL